MCGIRALMIDKCDVSNVHIAFRSVTKTKKDSMLTRVKKYSRKTAFFPSRLMFFPIVILKQVERKA